MGYYIRIWLVELMCLMSFEYFCLMFWIYSAWHCELHCHVFSLYIDLRLLFCCFFSLEECFISEFFNRVLWDRFYSSPIKLLTIVKISIVVLHNVRSSICPLISTILLHSYSLTKYYYLLIIWISFLLF